MLLLLVISLTDELCEILIWIEIPLCITGCFARGFSCCVWGLYLLVYDGVIMECEIRTKCLSQPWRVYWCSTSCICDVNFNYIYPSNRYMLTHWGRVTHICVSKVTIIGSDNGLSPGLYQDIIRTYAGILLIGKKNFSEIYTFSFEKIHLKMSSGKWRPFCRGLNTLNESTQLYHVWHGHGQSTL